MAATRVRFYFDPGCPWTWMTSRWLTEVSSHRPLEITWRSFSLNFKNEGAEIPEQYAVRARACHRALRVIEAVREGDGDGAVGGLYTELGRRIHYDGDDPLTDIAGVLSACQLDASYADAADDDAWDQAIRSSMSEALDVVGADVGSPVLVFADPQPVGFFGPIVSPRPTGERALQLWDGLAAVATVPEFYELKRSRTSDPELGPRP